MKNCKGCKEHSPGCRKNCEFWIKHEKEKEERYKKNAEEREYSMYLHGAVERMRKRQ